ncbi:MAG TPA: acyltransferase [Clostridium sp.]
MCNNIYECKLGGYIIKTLEKYYDKDHNIFNLIRFILAVSVIYSHSPMLINGSQDLMQKLTGVDIGEIAVDSFLVISGFLIIQSLINSNKVSTYMRKRFCRISPGLFVTLILCAFVLGPILTKLNLKDYFSFSAKNNPYQFFATYFTFDLVGSSTKYSFIRDVFSNNPQKTINGSLWSLRFEFLGYLILPIIYSCFKKKRIYALIATIFLAVLEFFQLSFRNIPGEFLFSYNITLIIRCGFYFMMGGVFYLYKDKIKIHPCTIALLLLLFIPAAFLGIYKYAVMIMLPYIVIGLGILVRKDPSKKYGDFSYGIYIYAYPIQQILIYLFKNKLNVSSLFFTSFLITLVLAILSYKFIEKPFIGLGHKKTPKKNKIVRLFIQ